MIIVFKWK